MTVLDAIIRSLTRAGEYNRDDHVAPAVILWPDKARQREPDDRHLTPATREARWSTPQIHPDYAAGLYRRVNVALGLFVPQLLTPLEWMETIDHDEG